MGSWIPTEGPEDPGARIGGSRIHKEVGDGAPRQGTVGLTWGAGTTNCGWGHAGGSADPGARAALDPPHGSGPPGGTAPSRPAPPRSATTPSGGRGLGGRWPMGGRGGARRGQAPPPWNVPRV